MTWRLFPRPQGSGTGGGSGLEDVTGVYPVEVDAFGTDRVVRVTLTPQTNTGALDPGLIPRFGRTRIGIATYAVNASALESLDGPTSGTTPTTVNIANTSYYASAARARTSTTTTLNNTVTLLFQGTPVARGIAAGTGGFFLEACWGYNALNADSRAFVGVTRVATIGAGEPSAMTDVIGFGFDSSDGAWSFMHNDGSGTCTKTALSLARPTVQQDVYYGAIWCDPAASTVNAYLLRRDDETQFDSAVALSNLPLGNNLLEPRFMSNVGPTTGVIASQDFMRMMVVSPL